MKHYRKYSKRELSLKHGIRLRIKTSMQAARDLGIPFKDFFPERFRK
jgi:hypothetical protein